MLKQEKEEFDAIRNEPHFEASLFVEELLPLLGDYFVGSFKLKDGEIICTFANGQIIKPTATQMSKTD